jgi:hypothetical protein
VIIRSLAKPLGNSGERDVGSQTNDGDINKCTPFRIAPIPIDYSSRALIESTTLVDSLEAPSERDNNEMTEFARKKTSPST